MYKKIEYSISSECNVRSDGTATGTPSICVKLELPELLYDRNHFERELELIFSAIRAEVANGNWKTAQPYRDL